MSIKPFSLIWLRIQKRSVHIDLSSSTKPVDYRDPHVNRCCSRSPTACVTCWQGLQMRLQESVAFHFCTMELIEFCLFCWCYLFHRARHTEEKFVVSCGVHGCLEKFVCRIDLLKPKQLLMLHNGRTINQFPAWVTCVGRSRAKWGALSSVATRSTFGALKIIYQRGFGVLWTHSGSWGISEDPQKKHSCVGWLSFAVIEPRFTHTKLQILVTLGQMSAFPSTTARPVFLSLVWNLKRTLWWTAPRGIWGQLSWPKKVINEVYVGS